MANDPPQLPGPVLSILSLQKLHVGTFFKCRLFGPGPSDSASVDRSMPQSVGDADRDGPRVTEKLSVFSIS